MSGQFPCFPIISDRQILPCIKKPLGHSKIQITLDTYSHLLPTMQDGAAERMERLLHGPKNAEGLSWLQIGYSPAGRLKGRGDRGRQKTPALSPSFGIPPAGVEPATYGLGNRRSIR